MSKHVLDEFTAYKAVDGSVAVVMSPELAQEVAKSIELLRNFAIETGLSEPATDEHPMTRAMDNAGKLSWLIQTTTGIFIDPANLVSK